MKKKILAALLICAVAAILLIVSLVYFSQFYLPDKTQDMTDNYSSTGNPCSSTEEFHQKADQIGYWCDGILVDSSVSDEEILQVLNDHGIEDSIEVEIFSPDEFGWFGIIGYYIESNESQYQEIYTTAENDENYTFGLRFSLNSYDLISPSVKGGNGNLTYPVFLLNLDSNKTREHVYQDLLESGVAIKKAKVVYYDVFSDYSPEERELLLSELNNDSRILFAFKEYPSGDIC
jgi:hypothetical protein